MSAATPAHPLSAVMAASHVTPVGTLDAASIKISKLSTMWATHDLKSVTNYVVPWVRSERLTTAVRVQHFGPY